MVRLVPKPLVPETGLPRPASVRERAAEPAEPAPASAPKPPRRVLAAPRALGAGSGAETPSRPQSTSPARPRSRASAAAFDPPSTPRDDLPSRSHNQGPPLHGGFKLFAWRKAQAEAWTPPRPEVLRRRLKYAAECGLTLREYTLEIMERGRWLTPEKDAARIAQIKSLRR
ncbi:hypothetical protein P2H44_16820 [Albimonas sp. CAU 1670]|uniref:hypothetical protein n=1 Tax=Albimonas sp. CAU 1670 TaxID=3032599 RepID=UPI0023DA64AA|nr:hypothetical protein [Albimonas sp. CAU 1670]MDF2234228.1 hypothetical protein [Albimonas sp. CAU 1670]